MLSSAFFIESDLNRAFCVRNVSTALWLPLSKYVFKRTIAYESTERSDHISFETRGNQGPLFFFNTICSWSADQRRAVNRVGVANELAGKIESGGPSCHPLGDGFKTSSDTSLINLHILCRSTHQDAVN